MNDLTLDERRVVFQILVYIMRADLVVKPEEKSFMNQVFKDLGLDIAEMDHLELLDMDYLSKKFEAFSPEKKTYSKKLFLGMAACDGYIDPREKKIIDSLG